MLSPPFPHSNTTPPPPLLPLILDSQECVPEDVDLKSKVFGSLDVLVDDETVLASSTSCLMPSLFCKDLQHRKQCIVAHPVRTPVECVASQAAMCRHETLPHPLVLHACKLSGGECLSCDRHIPSYLHAVINNCLGFYLFNQQLHNT